jgi:hypothetical protein
MKFDKSDIPLILNGFVVTLLLLSTNFSIGNLTLYAFAAITILWYGNEIKKNGSK